MAEQQTIFFVGILIVSTTAAKDPAADSSGKLLRDFFAEESQGVGGKYKWQVEETRIVSDRPHDIDHVVKTWTDKKKYHLVVTTGGTGFAVTDNTPEVSAVRSCYRTELIEPQAVKPLLEKEAPGLVYVSW
jgi:gephyrin